MNRIRVDSRVWHLDVDAVSADFPVVEVVTQFERSQQRYSACLISAVSTKREREPSERRARILASETLSS